MMKKVITMLVLGVTILSTALLGGCGKSDPTISKEKTPYAIAKEKNADGQYATDGYLTEKHPAVIKVKETVEGYTKAFTTADYKTTDGMEAYGYYTGAVLQTLKEKEDAAKSVKFHKDNYLITQFDSLKIDAMYINKDMNKAEIRGTYKKKYVEASDAYLKQRNMQKGDMYEKEFLFQAEKESDIWKISYYKVGEEKPVK